MSCSCPRFKKYVFRVNVAQRVAGWPPEWGSATHTVKICVTVHVRDTATQTNTAASNQARFAWRERFAAETRLNVGRGDYVHAVKLSEEWSDGPESVTFIDNAKDG